MSTWQDSLSNKIMDFKARMSTWQDSLSNKIIAFKAKMSTWQDSLSGKTIGFTAKMASWYEALSNKTISFTAKISSWYDALSNKVISFTAKIASWFKAEGGSYYGGQWHSFASGGQIAANGATQFWRAIPKYANGTASAHGTMFVAGEAGPEVVGHIGGRTEVLNKSQLAATMYKAIADGMAMVFNSFANVLLNKLADCANKIISAVLYTSNVPVQIAASPIETGATLLTDLAELANRLTFTAPVMASGSVMPYSVAKARSDADDIADAIETSNDDLRDVLTQAIASAAQLIVGAVRDKNMTVNVDMDSITEHTIDDINRRTVMFQASPLKEG